MLFSPSLMAQFSSDPLEVSERGSNAKPERGLWLHWTGTHAAFAELIRAFASDPTEAGRKFARKLELRDNAWCGLTTQTATELALSCVSPDAHREFSAAVAKLHADRLQPGTTSPAVCGGPWVVPLVLTGAPLASRLRERTKLPPRNIDIGITVSARTDWQNLTESLAPLAHAGWQYIAAGGALSLTAHHASTFNAPVRINGALHRGVVFSIRAPLTNQAAFASTASVQLKRGLCIPIAAVFGGSDRVLRAYVRKAGLVNLDGSGADAAALAALKLETGQRGA